MSSGWLCPSESKSPGTTVSCTASPLIAYIDLMNVSLHAGVRIRVDLTDPTATKHHAVFCYETTYFEWLPQVIPGDVLVLRNVQVGPIIVVPT